MILLSYSCSRNWSFLGKQEELEIYVQPQGFDLIEITGMWWDSSCDWNVGMRGYTLGETDQEGAVVELPSMRGSTRNVSSCVLVRRMSELRACGLGQKDRLVTVTLLWLCATGRPVRRREVDEATRSSLKVAVSGSCWGL